MAWTIRRKWSKSPKGDYQAMCDYCGVMWRRSKLWRDASGLLVCPDEGNGRSAVLLSNLEAQAAAEIRGPTARNDGGNFVKTNVAADGTVDTSVYVQRTDLEDI